MNLGILETAPSKIGLRSITWLAMERPDGSRFVVVAQKKVDEPGHYFETYEPAQARVLPSIPAAILEAIG